MQQRSLTLTAVLLLALLGLAAMPALAQEAADAEQPSALAYLLAHPGLLVRGVGLTPAQATATRALIQTARTAIRPVRADVQSLNQQIKAAFAQASPDACAIGALVVSRHDDYEKIEAALQAFDQGFAALLTPEQLAKYEALKTVLRLGGNG